MENTSMAKRQIKITAKATVKRTVRWEQRVQTQYIKPQVIYQEPQHSLSAKPTQNALDNLSNQIKTTQRQLSATNRRRSIPSGVYSRPVEDLFYTFDERRKSEELEDDAIYDVFISHASEDKKDFVDPLVAKLQDTGIRVWYDVLELEWGKSLREQIDNGIKRSKFAILVFSKHFFAKKWPQRELDGILSKETVSGSTPLPIWHDITYEELYELSPTMSGLFAYSTDKYSIDDICKALELVLEKDYQQA